MGCAFEQRTDIRMKTSCSFNPKHGFRMRESVNKQKQPFGALLVELMRSFRNSLGQRFKETGINFPVEQFGLLVLIKNAPEMIQRDIADMIKKHKSVILRQIDALEQKKLIERIPSEADKRRKNLRLTKLGEKTLCKGTAIEKQVVESLLSNISPDDLKTFNKVIKKIILNAKRNSESK